jgi:hypothetical protein
VHPDPRWFTAGASPAARGLFVTQESMVLNQDKKTTPDPSGLALFTLRRRTFAWHAESWFLCKAI